MSEWKLDWTEDEKYIHFKEMEGDKVILEFALDPPRHAKLYYALQAWFMDDDRFYTLVKNEGR